jgi:DNA transposition AAA+ family ATPase
MITNLQKSAVGAKLEELKKTLGGVNKIGTKAGVSGGTISNIINGKYDNISDKLFYQIINNCNIQFDGWQIAETTNYRRMRESINYARAMHWMMAISHKAGSGKTASIRNYESTDTSGGVFVIEAKEWGRRDFLLNLCQSLGINPGKGYMNMHELGDKVIRFFAERQNINPVLIIDEADKLKPAALRFLIPLYNELEDKCCIVICGTDNLEKEIKRGVAYNRKGYDELDSRLGRQFIHLIGATLQDVKAICTANGMEDDSLIAQIFEEAQPVRITHNNGSLRIVEDMRRIKRLIQRELLKYAA